MSKPIESNDLHMMRIRENVCPLCRSKHGEQQMRWEHPLGFGIRCLACKAEWDVF